MKYSIACVACLVGTILGGCAPSEKPKKLEQQKVTISWKFAALGTRNVAYDLNGERYGKGDAALVRVFFSIVSKYPKGTIVVVDGGQGLIQPWKNEFPFPIEKSNKALAEALKSAIKEHELIVKSNYDFEAAWNRSIEYERASGLTAPETQDNRQEAEKEELPRGSE